MSSNKRKKLTIITLGCQMNRHDSEWVAGLLKDGYDLTDNKSEADFLMVNTCAVRGKAEQKFFSLLGRLRPLKKAKRDMVIGVAGCVAQEMGKKIIEREPMVDIVVGTRAVDKTYELLEKFHETGEAQVDISDTSVYDDFPMKRESGSCAWVSIMRGCDNNCSYCIVPQTRGSEQSRQPESILNEIKLLAEDGYKEITLLGQNVNSYGVGLEPKINFPELLYRVGAVKGIERLRFVTSHPKDLSGSLIDAMAEIEILSPWLHLPIQSGSNRILKLMKRGYTFEKYFENVEKLKERVPDLSLTSDGIVGFPGETDEDFEWTVKAIERAKFDNVFLYKYSPRPETEAALLKNRVDPITAQNRFDKIMTLQRQISADAYKKWVGRYVDVLVEGKSKKNKLKYTGRTPQNLVLNFLSDTDYSGKIIRVKITGSGRYSLEGAVVTEKLAKTY